MMDKQQILESIKELMGYTETQNKCSNCKFYKEVENGYVDRMWDSKCTFSSHGLLSVKPNGRCNEFIDKKINPAQGEGGEG